MSKHTSETAAAQGINSGKGANGTTASGAAAPAVNDRADVIAAWSGRAALLSDIPSSSRACAPSASCAVI